MPNDDGISAQDFGPTYPELADEGAADFKPTIKCKVQSVHITGWPFVGTATSATVKIYDPNFGVLCSGTTPGAGPNFTVPITTKCKLRKNRTYWVGAQVAMDYDTQGQWYWATTDTVQGAVDEWRNPGGGIGIPWCVEFQSLEECLGLSYDYLFSVNGK